LGENEEKNTKKKEKIIKLALMTTSTLPGPEGAVSRRCVVVLKPKVWKEETKVKRASF
jgi:hypothetical protein